MAAVDLAKKRARELRRYHANRDAICAARRQKYAENPEPYREATRRWNAANKNKHKEMARRYRLANPEKCLAASRRKRGMPTPTRLCPATCECCGDKTSRALHLDHDHTTGKFRGWLCSNCNTAIGKLGDTLEGVQRAIKYLQLSELL